MSGKVVKFNPSATSIKPQAMSPAACLNRLRHLSLRSITAQNPQSALNFLRYAKGDSELIQDMKALVIRRISCEAFSLSNSRIYKAFDRLLEGFPNVPMMKDYMIPEVKKLGQAGEVIETCQSQAGDSSIILRAKREALLFNLTQLIHDNFDEFQGIQKPRFNKAEFIEVCSWIWDMLGQFQPRLPNELSELINIHVFTPELPFDIVLPD